MGETRIDRDNGKTSIHKKESTRAINLENMHLLLTKTNGLPEKRISRRIET